MSRFSSRDLLPRHTKGYLWVAFLVAIFLMMAMSENGIFEPKSYASESAQVTPPHRNYTVIPYPPPPSEETDDEVEVDVYTEDRDAYLSTPKSPPSTQAKPPPSWSKEEPTTFGGLDPNDVVVMVKTGATSLWRRLPIHLSSTLANPALTPNIIIYSDAPSSILNHRIIDSLANISSTLKSSPDFKLYHQTPALREQNLYLESGSMEGDHYLPGGWRLDKYKFLPMFQHVAKEMPAKKWYVYMEDDNYFFWANLYSWLATLDHTKPMLIGSPAFRLGEDFAHGGSGFAISGAALKVSFGADEGLAERWEEYAREQCCGDQVLSHVLKEHGVERWKGLDGTGFKGLQALPHWRMGFGAWNWCSAVLNVHKVHQEDVSRLWEFERGFRKRKGKNARIRYRDLFAGMAEPYLLTQRSEWDNYASAKSFSSSSDPDVNGEVSSNGMSKPKLTAAQLATKPWFSVEACQKACKEWDQCLSWRYQDDSCSLDHTAALGQKIDAGIRMESGWMLARIKRLKDIECEPLGF